MFLAWRKVPDILHYKAAIKVAATAELPCLFIILLQFVHWLMPFGNVRPIVNAGLWEPSLRTEYVRAHSTGLRTLTDGKEIQVRNLVRSMCSTKPNGRARAVCCRLMYSTRSNFYLAIADKKLVEFHLVPFRAGSSLALKDLLLPVSHTGSLSEGLLWLHLTPIDFENLTSTAVDIRKCSSLSKLDFALAYDEILTNII